VAYVEYFFFKLFFLTSIKIFLDGLDINKIKNDPQKLKELRQKAAERMKKRRSELADKKNQTGFKHIQKKITVKDKRL